MKSVFRHLDSSLLGSVLICGLTSCLLIAGLLWLVGLTINPVVIPLALILSVSIQKAEIKQKLVCGICAFVVIAICCVVASLFYDYSWDGRTYHLRTVYALAHGWNPIYEWEQNVFSDANSSERLIWINSYAKGIETLTAIAYSLFGNIDAGKGMNMVWAVGTFLYMRKWLAKNLEELGVSPKICLLFAIIISFPVIFISQFLSNYIDFALYYIVLWTIVCCIDIARENVSRTTWLMLVTAVFLGTTIKFNMLFWVGFVVGLFVLCLLVRKNYSVVKRIIIVSILTVVAALSTAAFNPFVTNTLSKGNPIYPLGLDSSDTQFLDDGAVPSYLKSESRVKQVVYSYFSAPSNGAAGHYKLPILIGKDTISSMCVTDAKEGGAGIVFPYILLFVVCTLVVARKCKYGKQVLVIVLVASGSLLLLPLSASHRYSCFYYLVPIMVMIWASVEYKKKWLTRVFVCLFGLNILLTSCAVLAFNTAFTYMTSWYVNAVNEGKAELVTSDWYFALFCGYDHSCTFPKRKTEELQNTVSVPLQFPTTIPTIVELKEGVSVPYAVDLVGKIKRDK